VLFVCEISQYSNTSFRVQYAERDLANLGTQLESPFVNPKEVAVLGKEYERVQKEMDGKLREWKGL